MLKLTAKQFDGELYVNHKNINFIRQSMEGLAVIHFIGGETLPTNVSYSSIIEKLWRIILDEQVLNRNNTTENSGSKLILDEVIPESTETKITMARGGAAAPPKLGIVDRTPNKRK